MDSTQAITVAKKQRTIQLPPAAYELGDLFEAATGVRFNRQTLAALLAFYFSGLDEPDVARPIGPSALWTRAATKIERGELAIEDLPFWLTEQFIASAEARIEYANSTDGTLPPGLTDQLEAARNALAALTFKQHALGSKGALLRELIGNRDFLTTPPYGVE